MVYYIKVTPEIARKFANIKLRNPTYDGNVLLWIGDLNAVPGDTIAERASRVGGALLTPEQARDEYFGGEGYTPAECHTPEYYKSDDNNTDGDTESEASDGNIDTEGNKKESEVEDE